MGFILQIFVCINEPEFSQPNIEMTLPRLNCKYTYTEIIIKICPFLCNKKLALGPAAC